MIKHIFSILVVLFFVGCKKKCDLPSKDVNSGRIVPNTWVKDRSTGYKHVIRSGDDKVSYNEGYTYEAIDWNEYVIICFPMAVSCNVQLEREVTIDWTNHAVDYTVTVNACQDCTDQYSISNMVLVQKFPENFTVRYKRIDKEVK